MSEKDENEKKELTMDEMKIEVVALSKSLFSLGVGYCVLNLDNVPGEQQGTIMINTIVQYGMNVLNNLLESSDFSGDQYREHSLILLEKVTSALRYAVESMCPVTLQ